MQDQGLPLCGLYQDLHQGKLKFYENNIRSSKILPGLALRLLSAQRLLLPEVQGQHHDGEIQLKWIGQEIRIQSPTYCKRLKCNTCNDVTLVMSLVFENVIFVKHSNCAIKIGPKTMKKYF